MERASITEVKNGLSAYIDRVKAGESILVTERGIPVAVIEPVTTQVDVRERLAKLERAGLIRRARGPFPRELLRTPGPKVRGSGSPAVDAIIRERREGR